MRLTTLILLTIIVAMGVVIHLQQRREERLRSALRFARNQNDEAIRRYLAQRAIINMQLNGKPVTLEDFLKYLDADSVRHPVSAGALWSAGGRLPMYVDPVGLQEAEKTMVTPVVVPATYQPIGKTLDEVLSPLGLAYKVQYGMLEITSKESLDRPFDDDSDP